MSALTLITIQNEMNFYAYPILMVLGVIGNIIVFIFFNRQRHNACSLYLMHSAIANLLFVLIDGFFQIFSISYYDETLRALILCKIPVYITNAFGQIAKTLLILACIDRYMITSDRAGLRAFSTLKRAKYFTLFSYIFWLVVSIHTLIWVTTSHGQCTQLGAYAIFYAFYIILFVGIIPSVILCVFGCLTFRNMRQLRRRIQPNEEDRSNTNNISLRRRDRDLLILVIAEVIVYIITTSLFPGILLELRITQYVMPNKSLEYILTEVFVINVAVLLLFVYSTAQFYIYMISSKSFRRDFKDLIMNRCLRLTRQPLDQTTLRVGTRITQGDTHV